MVNDPTSKSTRFIARTIALTAVLGLLATSPGLALGDAMWLNFGPIEAADVVHLSGGGVADGNYYAGQYGATTWNSANPDGSNPTSVSSFNTFCVDLLHEVSVGQKYEVTLQSTSTLTNGSAISYLYNSYGIQTISGNYNAFSLGTIGANDYAAALQLAIWKEVSNGALTYSGTSALVDSYVNAFITDAANKVASGNWLQSVVPGNQFFTPGQGFLIPTPEPTTLALLGAMVAGYGAVFFYRRRAALTR